MLALALGSALLAAQGAVENITVYRITPQNYSGVTNMGELLSLPSCSCQLGGWRVSCLLSTLNAASAADTGDAAGDAFFGLYEMAIPIMCSDEHMRRSEPCTSLLCPCPYGVCDPCLRARAQ